MKRKTCMYGNSRVRVFFHSSLCVIGGCLLAGCVAPEPVADRAVAPDRADQWAPASGTPAAVEESGFLRFACPFPAGTDRHVWDTQPVPMDLSGMSGLELVYSLDRPSAFRGLTWYARSGAGWYAAALPVGEGVQRVWVPFSAFEEMGYPAGWRNIHSFRLSPWTGHRGAGAVVLRRVHARQASIGVVFPGDTSLPNAREQAFGRQHADQWLADLHRLGLPAARIEENELNTINADHIRVLALPYNPEPSFAMIRAIEFYVRQGGRLIVCYNGNPELAAIVGVRAGRWLSVSPPGRLHRMAFTADDTWHGPAYVHQASTPHVLPVYPADDDARTLATWENASGHVQSEPALVISPRGAWFSYLLKADDDEARLRMLAFLLDRFMPSTALAAAGQQLENVKDRIELPPDRAFEALPDSSELRIAYRRAQESLRAKQAGRAWDNAQSFARLAERSVAKTFSFPRDMAWGIWDHSGRGLYAGDWPRTMQELAETGFSDVFVYVPRFGAAPSEAVLSAEPHGIKVHAWHICFQVDGVGKDRLDAYERQGRLQQSITGTFAPWLCPSIEENRVEEQARIRRLADIPGVGGVHLDYVRYPDEQHCYCPACRSAFERTIGERIRDWPHAVTTEAWRRAYLEWRANHVSLLVRDVSASIRQTHPDTRISVAVWPDVDTVNDRLGQDWPRWLREGWVDFVTPMSYTEVTDELADWSRRHATLPGAEGRIWAGLGVTSSHTRLQPAQALRQAVAATDAGAVGVVIFDLNMTVRSALFPALREAREGDRLD